MSTKAEELLTIRADSATPTREICIDKITVEVNDTTSLPYINIIFNGTPYIKDLILLNSSKSFSFGRELCLQHHRGVNSRGDAEVVVDNLRLEIKKTAAGIGSLIATCVVTGIIKK